MQKFYPAGHDYLVEVAETIKPDGNVIAIIFRASVTKAAETVSELIKQGFRLFFRSPLKVYFDKILMIFRQWGFRPSPLFFMDSTILE